MPKIKPSSLSRKDDVTSNIERNNYMEEILDLLGLSEEYSHETWMDMLEELCFENPDIADKLQEHIDEITYLAECRLCADTDYLLAEIEYGDGNHGSPPELIKILRESYEEKIECRD
ncbi:hypothetical protein GYA27_00915 [candidate division WWE3 bacterium]|uniref:Uncharacterized protein n=1 Tax=candidate division WWE3 bacterium TaxID=2053526 RepID=A0A7X9DJW1_UNCKA|nr:hypothetical protein [candidate division WWE3 bacterium]